MRLCIVLLSVFLPSVFAFATHGSAHEGRGACPFANRTSSNAEKRSNAFDPGQLIDVTGEHAYRPPRKGDLRGPCPGLNALANHGYLDPSGLTTLTEAIFATNKVFNMGLDLGAFLSVYALVMDGDPLSLKWSIGGPPSSGGILSGILGSAKGLSGSHNKYESDSSPTRTDAYLNNGDATTVNNAQFLQLYNLDPDHANYDIDILKTFHSLRFDHSVQNNPHFFYAPLAGLVVVHAAFIFIPTFMSNYTENGPVLDGVLFEASSETHECRLSDDLKAVRGQERIPNNWYRRPTPYTIPNFNLDLIELLLEYPKYIAVGGNTGTVNSFTPVNLGDLTGGGFNAKNLLEGNNLMCFMYQAVMSALPDVILGGVVDTLILQYVTPLFAGLGCPELTQWDSSLYGIYPGAKDR
ncbi:Cloroperoxidase [Hymenopellis radicata]|nr:Cloroperoxidase [Hymenopellis radicata]